MRGRRHPEIDEPLAEKAPTTSPSGGVPHHRAAPTSSSNPHEKHRPDCRALRLRLLNLIRTFYLEALSRLPSARLWSTHARGVLVAGHCYDPLSPVDNILVTAIWADLLQAIASSASDSALAPTHAAYLAAAEAAHHPVPCAMAHFTSTVLPTVEHDADKILRVNRPLSARHLDPLSAMLVPSPIPQDFCAPPPLTTTWVAAIIKSRIQNCKDAKEFSRRLTEATLCKYAQQTGQHYELHFICGLHMFIRSEAYWHINFLARPAKDAAHEMPICFFAEATVPMGEDDQYLEEDIVLCCPVNPSTIAPYTIDLQKRGQPHAHMLIWLDFHGGRSDESCLCLGL